MGGLILGVSYWGLKNAWGISEASQWLLLSAVMLIYLLWTYWGILEQNHRAGETDLLDTIGAGNAVSMSRGILVAMIAGFLFLPRPPGVLSWAPAILFIVSDIADFADGILARVANRATRMGESLDVNLDGLGVFVVTLLAFQYGTVPVWYLPVGIARYIFVIGIQVRKTQGKPIYDLEPSVFRRGMAGLQIGFVTVMIFPVVSPPVTVFAATLFMIPFIGGFIYDWLWVSGRVRSPKEGIKKYWEKVWTLFGNWGPVLFRAIIATVLASRFAGDVDDFSVQVETYGLLGVIEPRNFLLVFLILEGSFIVLLTLGAAGRVTSVIALIALGVRLQYDVFDTQYAILLVSLMGILFLGSGKYSLWQPMEGLIHHRIGE